MFNLPSTVALSTAPWRGPRRRKRRNLLQRAQALQLFRSALVQGRRDWGSLIANVPALANWSTQRPHYEQSLRRWHQLYTATVSEAMMAASLETAAFVCFAVDALGARTVADFGSGFSSVALRAHAQRRAELTVWSVDDDAFWLEKTGAFLRRHGLNYERMLNWPDFAAGAGPHSLDVILHDLGDMRTRRRVLPTLWEHLAPGGVMILDDMHKPIYRQAALRFSAEQTAQNGAGSYSLRAITADRFARYAWLMQKNAAEPTTAVANTLQYRSAN
jgi:predicted O-methyltransferase YrrM